MGVRLQFEGIRCFSDPQEAVIRPITLLVGENSSGKTTFLALCRIAYALANGQKTVALFNETPFWLGAYDQIATYRGGRRGYVASFTITIHVDDRTGRSSLRTEYTSLGGQPVPRVSRLEVGGLVIQQTNRDGEPPSILMSGSQGTVNFPFDRFLEGVPEGDQIPLWGGLAKHEIEAGGGASVFSQSDWESKDRALRAIQQEFRRYPYAIAPIRTSPLRTYDPIGAEPSPEGSHVPMLLAALSRSSHQQQWIALQSALKEFGSESGLFEDIEIVEKGKKESDPFQVGVRSGGRTFNLIDVGYGVSQALPILVDTLRRNSAFETFLLQQPEVHLHPKAQAELASFFAKQADQNRRFVIETHSDHLVDRIRMEVRRKRLTPEDVSLLYFERRKSSAMIHNLELDRNGSNNQPTARVSAIFLERRARVAGYLGCAS